MKENEQEKEKIHKTISVRVPDGVYEYLEGMARSDRRRMSDVVRIILEDYVSANKLSTKAIA